jgi:hypothetical protein
MRDSSVCNLFVGYSNLDNHPISEGQKGVNSHRSNLKFSKKNLEIPLDKWGEFNG